MLDPIGDEHTPAPVTFTLLGRLQVLTDGVGHAPTAPKLLQLMGLLLMRPGAVVPTDTIVEELWDGRPPRSVRSTLQTYVYHLRRYITEQRLCADPEAMLATRPPGYVLAVAPEQVDVAIFDERCRQGRALLAVGRTAEAGAMFRTALDLWSGPALANVACGPVLSRLVLDLQERHRTAFHSRVEAEIACGAHRELVGELRSAAAADRYDEALQGQLMRVLACSGRRTEALATFRELRKRLVDELGMEPCGELQSLHLDLLGAG